jgi:hypothetical protein
MKIIGVEFKRKHGNEMSDDRKPLFRYNESSRRAILTSIDLSEGAVADELIEMCECISQSHLDNVIYYTNYPSLNESENRINSILYHLSEAIRHIEFDGDRERRDKFWANVFVDANGDLPQARWFGWSKFARSIEAAHHHLRRFAERRLKTMQLEKGGGLVALETSYLKQLSSAYCHILNRKPGRSKSTIGPFVRFAWAAMEPILCDRAPTVETLNERWARLKYDAGQTKIDLRAIEELKRNYF